MLGAFIASFGETAVGNPKAIFSQTLANPKRHLFASLASQISLQLLKSLYNETEEHQMQEELLPFSSPGVPEHLFSPQLCWGR